MATITSTEAGATGRYINLGTPSANNDVGAQTIIVYCKPTGVSASTSSYLLAKTPSASVSGPRLAIINDGSGPYLVFGAHSSEMANRPLRRSLNASLSYGAWQHLEMTWDGSVTHTNIRMYITGTEVSYDDASSNSGSGSIVSDSSNALFLMNRGNSGSLGRDFIGDVGYFARWSRILDSTERATVRSDGPLAVPSGLILCWANDQDYSTFALTATARSTRVTGSTPTNTALGGSADISLTLTGQSFTHTQGALAASTGSNVSVTLTGQTYTLAQGTLGVSVGNNATVALTGQSLNYSQGSLTPGVALTAPGQTYALSQGTLGVSTSATVALTGQTYAISQGTLGVSTSKALTGQTYALSQGTLGVSVGATASLTGQTYALSQGTLGVSVGATVALTGQTYTHTQGTLGVSVGNNVTVALTGQDLNYSQGTFVPGVALTAPGQTYSLTQGTLAVVVGNNATVALTGQSYALTQGLVGKAATVGLTGQYVSFTQGTLGVTTDTNYYVSLAGQNYALTQGTLGVINDTNYIVPLTGQNYTYSQRAPSVMGAIIPRSGIRLYTVPPEDRRYTVSTY